MPYDVIIVGAGLSGLAAAEVLTLEQKKVLLLEARDRVGGRVVRRPCGNAWVDEGALWVESDSLQEYVEKKLGLKLIEPYAAKNGLRWTISYGGKPAQIVENPAPDEDSWTAAEDLDLKLGRLVSQHGVTADPWDAKEASVLDGKTLAQWISETRPGNGEADKYARYYVDWNSRFQQSGGSASQMSLLHAVFERYFVQLGDGSARLVLDGAGQIPEKLSEKVQQQQAELFLSSKVVTIAQDADGVEVTTGADTKYRAGYAIVAIPPILSGAIKYDPPLPELRLKLVQRLPMGTIAKVNCVYANAWWRTDDRSGNALGGGDRAVQYVVDSGNAETNTPGVLTCFIQGEKYLTWHQKQEAERKQAVTDDIHAYFGGSEVATPCIGYAEADWPAYELTGGAYNAYAGVGTWTEYGRSLREPHQRVYWAGTEMATVSYGGMPGAVSAGEAAAKQVLQKLG